MTDRHASNPLWRELCVLGGVPPDSSIDRVFAAVGVLGRGTFQRAYKEGRISIGSLLKLAQRYGAAEVQAATRASAGYLPGVETIPPQIEAAPTDWPFRNVGPDDLKLFTERELGVIEDALQDGIEKVLRRRSGSGETPPDMPTGPRTGTSG